MQRKIHLKFCEHIPLAYLILTDKNRQDTFMKRPIPYIKPDIEIPPEHRYRLSRRYIQIFGLVMPTDFDAHRLFHVLLYLTFQSQTDRSKPSSQPHDGYVHRCIEIRTLLGLEDSRCNRAIIRGAESLIDSGHFASLQLSEGRDWLHWKFDQNSLSHLLDQDQYAMLDVRQVPNRRGVIDYLVYEQVSLTRRMACPHFTLMLDDLEMAIGRLGCGWSKLSRHFLAALKQACALYGMTAWVHLGLRPNRRGVSTIEVRLDYAGSKWTPAALAKMSPDVQRVIRVEHIG